MPLVIKETTYENPDPGLHDTKIVGVKDLGLQETNYGKVEKVQIIFEVLDQKSETTGKNLQVSIFCTKKLSQKSNLTKYLTQLGVDPTPPLDLDEIIGLTPQVVIAHNKKDGTTYANVDTIIPPKRSRQKNTATDEI